MHSTISQRIRGRLVAIEILCMAIALILFLSSNWTTWAGEGEVQRTDDAYLRADVTPLSTKVAGTVASVEVSGYQTVHAGDLLARLRDEDFRAQVDQADAAVRAAESGLVNKQRQKELQDVRVRQAQTGVSATQAEISAAQAGVQAALKVHEVFYGILVGLPQKKAAEQEVAYSRTRVRESEKDVRTGSALRVAVLEGQADLLDNEQTLLTLDLRIADLNTELNDLLGLPLNTSLELSPPEPASLTEAPRDDALRMALAQNPEIATAMESVRQAKAALRAAKSAYIPDVSLFARHSYQNGVPFLVHNFGAFGVALNYDVFELGKRRAMVREREAQLAQADENFERVKDAVDVKIDRSLNKVKRTNHMLQVTAEVVKLHAERERVAENQLTNGAVLVSVRRQASAAVYKGTSQHVASRTCSSAC